MAMTAEPGPDDTPDEQNTEDEPDDLEDPYGNPDDEDETTLVINHWRYAGRGYTHPSDAIAASYFAETRRQSRQAAREAAALAI
jgi:hypothetical protein